MLEGRCMPAPGPLRAPIGRTELSLFDAGWKNGRAYPVHVSTRDSNVV